MRRGVGLWVGDDGDIAVTEEADIWTIIFLSMKAQTFSAPQLPARCKCDMSDTRLRELSRIDVPFAESIPYHVMIDPIDHHSVPEYKNFLRKINVIT